MKAHIKGIAHYLPKKILSNEILNIEFPEWSADKISSKTGIFERRIAGDEEFVSDMAIKAAEKLFTENNIDKRQIDFLLLCTQSPDYFLPTTACIVQDKLGLSKQCGALDFNLGCSGFVYGLALAKGLVVSGIAKNILLVTSETYSKHINSKDKSNRTIFGDAASATLVSVDGNMGAIHDFVLGSDGSGAENLIVKNGGMKHPKKDGVDIIEDGKYSTNDNNLYMNGKQVFNFTSKAVPVLIKQTLEKHELSIEDIDVFIFHQANRFMLDYIRRKVKIPKDKFYIFLEKCGNTVSSTIPVALQQAFKDGAIQKGNKVLLAGFGVGYSWGATIISC